MTDLTIPKNLVEQICKGNCVLFLGAGISMGEGGLPGGGQLAQELAQRCDYPGDDLSLPRVAQYYADTIDKADLLQYICQCIREAWQEPMETHQLIAALPFKTIVSTNYDCLIERALEEAGKPYNVIVTDKQVGSWDERVVNLLKIHGCVTQWESMVITEDDYLEFFERRPEIATNLRAEAARRSLLFMGHGLGDDDFNRIYLEVTRNLGEFRHKSYAVQLDPNRADVIRWEKKKLEIISAIMGSTEEGNEGPVHQVWLDAFYIARTPVTNAEYSEVIEAGGYERREYWTEAGWEWKEKERRTQPWLWDKLKDKRDHPVCYLIWYEAVAYARWRGAMLPSEAQWEKAARGGLQIPNLKSQISDLESQILFVDNPNPERRYPWGDQFHRNKCNTSESGIGDTTPVGKYSPEGDSPYSVADMAGNVREWTGSLYWPYPYSVRDGRENSEASGRWVFRGGSFDHYEGHARCSCRFHFVPNYGGTTSVVGWGGVLLFERGNHGGTEGVERGSRIPRFRISAMQRFERGEHGGTEGAERGSAYSAVPYFRDAEV